MILSLCFGAVSWSKGFWALAAVCGAMGLAQACSVPAMAGAIADCFRQMQYLNCDLIFFALREGKSEIRHLTQIKKKYRKIHFILYLTPDFPEANLEELKQAGFDSAYKANSPEQVREIVHDLLKPGDLPPRLETPHPIPAVLDDRV